jgi:hypothetical protein
VLSDLVGQPEIEPNQSCAFATPIPTPMGWRHAAIGVPGDIDYYSFFASTGQVLTVIADGDPERDGIGTDVIVDLIDSDCQTLLFSANSSGTGSITDPPAEGFRYAISKLGTYYIRVRAAKTDATGTYDLLVASQNPGQLQFSAPAYSVNEDGGNAVITVNRVGGNDGPATVQFSAFGGTATVNLDYLSTGGTLTFLDGESVKQFSVPIVNDGIPEGDEWLNLALSNPTGGASLGSPSLAKLTIVEQGPRPTVNVGPDPKGWLLTWPLWAYGYHLESTMTPADPNSWQPLPTQPFQANYRYNLAVPPKPMDFFRLKKP